MTPAEFAALYPEFSSAPTIQVQSAIDDATYRIAGLLGNAAYDRALGLITAHLLTLSTASSQGGSSVGTGAVTSIEVADEFTISYAAPAQELDPSLGFALTKYGRMWLELRRSLFVGGAMIA